MKKTTFLALICLFGASLLEAQDYLGDDLAFFQKKADLYQLWILQNGLSNEIKVDSIQLQKNGMELELWLSLKTTDPDTAAGMWTSMIDGFKQQNSGKTLQGALFKTFARMMEIPAEQGNVQVYFPRKDRRGYNKCFYVWIWEEKDKITQEERINNCKALPIDITITPPIIRSVSNNASIEVEKSKTDRRLVFEDILKFAHEKYIAENQISERNPKIVEDKITDYTLKFSIEDLSREVLTNEKESWWCLFVNTWWGPCNDMRRERLEFQFNFIPTEDGYLLKGEITGKFGSGIYRPRKSGYMDMEPDFQSDFLEPYIHQFQKELKKHLEIQSP